MHSLPIQSLHPTLQILSQHAEFEPLVQLAGIPPEIQYHGKLSPFFAHFVSALLESPQLLQLIQPLIRFLLSSGFSPESIAAMGYDISIVLPCIEGAIPHVFNPPMDVYPQDQLTIEEVLSGDDESLQSPRKIQKSPQRQQSPLTSQTQMDGQDQDQGTESSGNVSVSQDSAIENRMVEEDLAEISSESIQDSVPIPPPRPSTIQIHSRPLEVKARPLASDLISPQLQRPPKTKKFLNERPLNYVISVSDSESDGEKTKRLDHLTDEIKKLSSLIAVKSKMKKAAPSTLPGSNESSEMMGSDISRPMSVEPMPSHLDRAVRLPASISVPSLSQISSKDHSPEKQRAKTPDPSLTIAKHDMGKKVEAARASKKNFLEQKMKLASLDASVLKIRASIGKDELELESTNKKLGTVKKNIEKNVSTSNAMTSANKKIREQIQELQRQIITNDKEGQTALATNVILREQEEQLNALTKALGVKIAASRQALETVDAGYQQLKKDVDEPPASLPLPNAMDQDILPIPMFDFLEPLLDELKKAKTANSVSEASTIPAFETVPTIRPLMFISDALVSAQDILWASDSVHRLSGLIAPKVNSDASSEKTAEQDPMLESKGSNFKPYKPLLGKYRSLRAEANPEAGESLTFHNKLDFSRNLCRFEMDGGQCLDSACKGQHFRDMAATGASFFLKLNLQW